MIVIGSFHTCFLSIICFYGVFNGLSSYGSEYILKQREHKEGQKDEFMGCTMTSHGLKLDATLLKLSNKSKIT